MKIGNIALNMVILIILAILIAGCKTAEQAPAEKTEEIVDSGVLAVQSSPSSAQVYVNGEFKGITPFTFNNMPVGTYNVVVKKDGFNDFKREVTIIVGRTEEIDATLTPMALEEQKPVERTGENAPVETNKLNKIELSIFAMYYDFENVKFSNTRTDTSDLFSRKYDTYVNFVAITPAKIKSISKPIKDVTKDDCASIDGAVVQLNSDQTLCVKTIEGNIFAVGGSWNTTPSQLEWVPLS